MIFNNLRGMEFIRQNQDASLTPELVFAIHTQMMQNTIDAKDLGRLQTLDDERVNVVSNNPQKVVHEPPPADQLPGRVQAMCDFANGKGETEFFHPVIRAIVLHLWLAYDHPFADGNGRTDRIAYTTARADLLSLVKIDLLERRTIGNAMHFSAGSRLRELSGLQLSR